MEEKEKLLEEARGGLAKKTSSAEEHEHEVNALRREVDMKEISIKLHDQRMRVLKDEVSKMRMQRGGYSESVQEAGLIEDFERV